MSLNLSGKGLHLLCTKLPAVWYINDDVRRMMTTKQKTSTTFGVSNSMKSITNFVTPLRFPIQSSLRDHVYDDVMAQQSEETAYLLSRDYVYDDVITHQLEKPSDDSSIQGLEVEKSEYGYRPFESAFIVFVLSSFILLAISGNVLVIVAILTDRHLRKTSNFFIVSLAVADALVALLVMTFSVVNEVQ